MPRHELDLFLQQTSQELAAEYQRIRDRAAEDPGTAGDEGESNWAELLRNWLPPQFPIVTKGRILDRKGNPSPQVDVLVLSPAYPKPLRSKKMYLAGGVVAAFECKLTLKDSHLEKFFRMAKWVRDIETLDKGTPLAELRGGIRIGLLAHAYERTTQRRERIDEHLATYLSEMDHPRQLFDVLCVADLDCWHDWTLRIPPRGAFAPEVWDAAQRRNGLFDGGTLTTMFARYEALGEEEPHPPNPLYVLVSQLMKSLAWEYADLRGLSLYWQFLEGEGATSGGSVAARNWEFDVLSPEVASRLRTGSAPEGRWDPWSVSFG